MREIVAETNVQETIRKLIVNCIRDNKCESTQIWLSDEVVQKLKSFRYMEPVIFRTKDILWLLLS